MVTEVTTKGYNKDLYQRERSISYPDIVLKASRQSVANWIEYG